MVKPSRHEFKSWSWNIYIGIIVLFISLFILYYYFLLFTFLFYLSTVSFHWYAFFFKLFAIYALNILEYMNRQQQPGKTVLICCRDAQADLGLRCPHMQKEPRSKLVIKTEGVHKYYFFTFLPWVFHVCDGTLCTVCFLHTLHQQKYSICMRKKFGFVTSKIGRFAQLSNVLLVFGS